ncbi:hypothetical protein LOC67_08770 [Stieleria sp. JC731]|uniref:hypothetical protein n=1 Tax=Pirellulaceae TaxID=2691357 RepID=UPI001E5FB228|nr:hypothetical protein [Stieleria sp. JC731]MCC9600653.1 hypothetical protein [Stieleria sp. JC731]
MDNRWRTQHDAIPPSKPDAYAAFQGHAPQPHPSWQPPQQFQPHAQASFVAPAPITRDPNAAAIYHQLAQANAEIMRLRGVLGAVHGDMDRRVAQLQHQLHSQTDTEKASLQNQIRDLQAKNADLNRSHQQQLDQHRESDQSRIRSLQTEVHSLKHELSNAASAAATEQQQLADRIEHQNQRHQAILAERDHQIRQQETLLQDAGCQIESLTQQLEQFQHRNAEWIRAHDSASELAEWLQTQCRKQSRDLVASENAYDQLHDEAMRLLRQRDTKILKLNDTVEVLQNDHEEVELINSDLDHCNDRLRFEIEELVIELEDQLVASQRDQQQLVQATQSVSDQLATTNLKLESVTREKQALAETIAQHRELEDEFDALLFAKEQEISAIKRTADDAQRQSEQLRRDNAASVGQGDQLRSQVREQEIELIDLRQRLAEANEQVDHAMAVVDERDQQIREIQTSVRAAEANATLQQHEVVREYTIEIDRLESLIAKFEQDGQSRAEEVGDLSEKIATLESDLKTRQTAIESLSDENNQLQQQLESSLRSRDDLEEELAENTEQLVQTGLALKKLRESGGTQEIESQQLRQSLNDQATQLAEYADRIAKLQLTIESLQTERRDAVTEAQINQVDQPTQDDAAIQLHHAEKLRLEQELVATRERYHHANLVEQRRRESVEEQLQRYVDENSTLSNRLRESNIECEQLQQRLETFAGFDQPIAEAKRLSRELARHISQFASERESLYRRIEQLHEQRLQRAA